MIISMKYLIIIVCIYLLFSCENKEPIVIINSPNNVNSVCIFKYRKEMKSYTVFSCNCNLRDNVNDLLLSKKGHLIVRNWGRDSWECLLEWDGENPVIHSLPNWFQKNNKTILELKEIDTLPKLYFHLDNNSRYIRIAQFCNIENDYCID